MTRGRRDERGVVIPSRLMLVGLVGVALAGAAYVATGPKDDSVAQIASATPTPSASSTPKPSATTRRPAPKPTFTRADTVVEVFNNSGISGLAGRTSAKATSAGWNVVGSDNWYGTIPATTVYYPARLKPAARALARDLGISRLKPAVDPMRLDRLTVILTRDYA